MPCFSVIYKPINEEQLRKLVTLFLERGLRLKACRREFEEDENLMVCEIVANSKERIEEIFKELEIPYYSIGETLPLVA